MGFGRHGLPGSARSMPVSRVACLLDAQPDEVLFTSGATEANNLAIFGLVAPLLSAIVTSTIEHHASWNRSANWKDARLRAPGDSQLQKSAASTLEACRIPRRTPGSSA